MAMGRIDILDLKNLNSMEKLLDTFTHKLNYDYENSSLSTRRWKEDIANLIVNNEIKLLARHQDFYIIYCQIEDLRLGIERPIVNQLLKEHPYLLVIFSDKSYQNWHFVNIKYDEEIKNRRLFRRIVIGPDERLHTAAECINKLEIINDKISPLEIQKIHDGAFDVEKVTKEFYEKFSEIFHILAKDIAEENPQIDVNKEGQMILNRLIFLYFIQKKGWLNNNKRYLYENFLRYWKKDPQGNSFYSDFLFKLFQALSYPEDLYKDLLGEVPFLNGGLFEVNPFPIHPKLQPHLIIKNSTFKCIFDQLLEHFNFTVREDTPLDVEVAIDPEMLGKIFENLVLKLEKGEDLRKKTGSYYTPRVIVHFMCQESLKQYLITESEIERSKIELLFKMNPADQLTEEEIKSLENSFTLPQARLLKSLIKKAYVLDPAVGSGAFLVGMLHEMVSITKLLDIREFGKDHIQKTNYDYELKRQLIETCLYGVDIQERAVRICELRLWLCLIVDFEKIKGEEVPPLPNLNYKIRCGDSLIEKLFGHNVQLDQLVQTDKGKQLIDEIKEDKEAYFLARDIKEKNRIELGTLVKQCELMELLIKEKQKSLTGPQLSFLEETAKERKQREEFEKTKREYEQILLLASNTRKKVESMLNGKIPIPAEDINELKKKLGISFIWKLDFAEVFKEKGGFDVVIGNPPYDVLNITEGSKVSVKELEYYKESALYSHALGQKLNLYRLMTILGVGILRQNGTLCFIIPYAILGDSSAQTLRKYILKNKQLVAIDAFPERDNEKTRVFEAVKMSTCIINLKNIKGNDRFIVRVHKTKDISLTSSYVRINISEIEKMDPINCCIPMTDQRSVHIVMKVLDNPKISRLSNMAHCYEGEINLTFHKKYLRNNKNGNATLIKGAQIDRYRISKVIGQGEIKYLDSTKYLKENKGDKSLHHKEERIVMQGITGVNEPRRLKMTYLPKGIFCGNSVNYILVNKNSPCNIKYILAILNSKLINWLFKTTSTNSNVNAYEVDLFPVIVANAREQEYIIKLVDILLNEYEKQAHVLNRDLRRSLDIEHQIDQKVYELYELTEEEIKLFEENMKS